MKKLTQSQLDFLATKIEQANNHLPEGVVPTVSGVGYLDGAVTTSQGKFLKSYQLWASMLKRCYSVKSLEQRPTYLYKTVCPSWYNYANFKSWYGGLAGKLALTNYPLETLAIDSDLIPFVNYDEDRYQHDYSRHTVLMLPKGINSQLATVNGKSNRPNLDLLTGIYRSGKGYQFSTYKSDGQRTKSRTYRSQEEAHKALCKQKAARLEATMRPFFENTSHIQPNLKYVFSYFTKWRNIQKANVLHRMVTTL
ncbi:hypothetical protein [Vibrio sp. DNB22_12_1]